MIFCFTKPLPDDPPISAESDEDMRVAHPKDVSTLIIFNIIHEVIKNIPKSLQLVLCMITWDA